MLQGHQPAITNLVVVDKVYFEDMVAAFKSFRTTQIDSKLVSH